MTSDESPKVVAAARDQAELIDMDWLIEQVFQRTYLGLVEADTTTTFH